MPALSDAQTAAYTAFLKGKRESYSLTEEVVTKLAAWFKTKGVPVNERRTALAHGASALDKEELMDEWKEFAVAAGLEDTPDINSVGRWISKPAGPGRSARSGKAAAVADALARSGIDLDRDTELAINNALVEADKGVLEAQCACVEVIWVIYTGQSPGVEDKEWFDEMRAASIMAQGKPKVDIRGAKSYAKKLSTTTMVVLERALLKDKTGMLFSQYYNSTIEKLNQLGYTAAATRFISVAGFAEKCSNGQPALKLQFLYNYFFDEYVGMGMPVEKCHTCALTLGVQQTVERKLTVPEEDLAFRQQTLGGWAGQSINIGSMQQHYAGQHGQDPQMLQMSAQMQQMQTQLQQWNLWAAAQQSGQQPPGDDGSAGGGSAKPPPTVDVCTFCNSKGHLIDKCSEMHKARADNKASKKAAKKALEDAQKAAAAAAAAGGAA